MHFLITGHTGFKGSWLSIWLHTLGHQVSGIALDPLPDSLFEKANLSEILFNDFRIDIRDREKIAKVIQKTSPEVVFHFAAQPLVRESYKDPRGTIETNLIGTMNVVEAVGKTSSVKAHLVITTDKVYRNVNQSLGYKENDPLGGEDPYSASKAMADIFTHSWIASFGGPPTAIVRAGNVIGGGDVSPDRLLPDLINAYSQGKAPTLRYPKSVRPWQHVLDCLNGYLTISDGLIERLEVGEINIGPGPENFVTVENLANVVADLYGSSRLWSTEKHHQPHEAELLALDASKAKELLGWSDKLKFREAVEWTVDWHKRINAGESAFLVSKAQIVKFNEIN